MSAPGFYVAHHYFLDAVDGADRCYKFGRTKYLTKRLTHRAYKTCFDGPFKYVLVVETADADTAGRIENLILKKHSDRRLLQPNGSKCKLMKMTFQAILESVKIILSKHFPNLKVNTNPDYFEDERYKSDDED